MHCFKVVWASRTPCTHSVLAPVRNVVRALQTLRSWPYVVTLHDIDFAALPPEIDAHEHAERASFIRLRGRLIVPSRYISRRLDAMLGPVRHVNFIQWCRFVQCRAAPDQCQAGVRYVVDQPGRSICRRGRRRVRAT